MPDPRSFGCTRKRHPNKEIAAKAANFMKEVRGKKLYPHACVACGGWHLHDRAVLEKS